jgi:hypothetical protein
MVSMQVVANSVGGGVAVATLGWTSEKMDGSDRNTTVNVRLCDSGLPASQQHHLIIPNLERINSLLNCFWDGTTKAQCKDEAHLCLIETKLVSFINDQTLQLMALNSKLDNFLHKIGAA